MKIEEHSDSKVIIRRPTFNCDGCLGDHIPSPLPNGHHFMLFAGKAASGKTSLALSLLCANGKARVYRKCYEHVHIIAPNHSLHSLKQDYFKNHPHDRIHNELTGDILSQIKESAKELRLEEDGRTLILIDDMTSALKEKWVQKELCDIAFNRRHLGISVWILAQSYKMIPLNVRKALTHLVLFKPTNKKEFQAVFEELIYLDKDTAEDLSRFVFREPHDHLFLDVNHSKFYRNWNTLSIEDTD